MKSSYATINAVIAIAAGVIVLAGYFIPGLEFIRSTLLGWASVTAGFALLAGVLNLLSVHWSKIVAGDGSNEAGRKPSASGGYSILLILAFLITLVVTLLSGPTGKWTLWIFNNIQVPVEAALLGLLAVTLAGASLQLLRRRFDLYSGLFLGAALVVLLTAIPIYGVGEISWLVSLRQWLMQVPAMAGVRGILMGVALGAIATGLRVLMGADRPYGS